MLISVTQDDIDKGEKFSVCGCPTARAIARHLGLSNAMSKQIMISRTEIKIGRATYVSRPVVRHFTFDFDVGNPVVPFSFDLEMVDDSV